MSVEPNPVTLKAVLVAALVFVTACADDIVPDPGPAPVEPSGASVDTRLLTRDNGDGTWTTLVDATSKTEWVGFDLDTGQPVDGAVDATWDLAFQRFHIRTRGGVHGSGGVVGLALVGTDFASLAGAPDGSYFADDADGDDENADADTIFQKGEGWYAYDFATHKLSPRDTVYVLRSDAGRYFKVQVRRYYDDAGTPAQIEFNWGELQAPPSAPRAADLLDIDASSATAWVYVKVGSGIVQPGDPASSRDWDVAFRRTEVRTNGGASGTGLGGAQVAPTASFDEVTLASTLGFTVDAEMPRPGPPGSGTVVANAVLSGWYHYDAATHAVTPKDATFLVRTGSGDYAKLRIERYASGIFEVRLAPVSRTTPLSTLAVDATSPDVWSRVRLSDGVVLPTDAPAHASWDLAFRRTEVQTNSGTSGSGVAGALVATGVADLGEVREAPADGYLTDSIQPPSGAPGSAEWSGNEALAGWWSYDAVSHAVSPKPLVYLVRTNDGAVAKLRIRSYASGQYTLEYAYSGPGHRDFPEVAR